MNIKTIHLEESDIKKIKDEELKNALSAVNDFSDTVIFGAAEDDELEGVIILKSVNCIHRVEYMYVKEKSRRCGVGGKLLEVARRYDPKLYICSDMPSFDELLEMGDYAGMKRTRTFTVSTFERNAHTIELCRNMMDDTGCPAIKMLEEHGYRPVKMSEAGDALTEKLGEEIGLGYDEDLNPFNIEYRDEDESYITEKDGFPAAFIVCHRKEGTLYIDLLSAHENHRGTGAAMMLVFMIMRRFIEDEELKRVKVMVMNENRETLRLMEGKLNELVTQREEVAMYEFE